MDVNQLTASVKNTLGVDITDEEKQAFAEVLLKAIPKDSATEQFIKFLQGKGFDKHTIDTTLQNAIALANLWLLRYIVDYTTEADRENINKAVVQLEEAQILELLSQLMINKVGKRIEDLSDELWVKVVDAYMTDIDAILVEAQKS